MHAFPTQCHDRSSGESERLVVLLLHAHLPECRRPGLVAALEETWFFEALTESYLPLVGALDRLRGDGVYARLTLSLSPILLDQLRDPSLLGRYRQWLAGAERLARHDAERSEGDLREIAAWHADFFSGTRRMWEDRCRGDLLGALREHAGEGRIELATTCATHAFLPAHQGNPAAIEAQVGTGLDTFAEAFGHRPTFFWLPECGYFPGLEDTLGAAGIRAFALESHGVAQARPAPATGIRSPLCCPKGILAFGRDNEASRRVWSSGDGYPGHPDYREFHRDRIHELPEALFRGKSDGLRRPSGLKYWRITGSGVRKTIYDPDTASRLARRHADDFVERLFPEGRPNAGPAAATPEIAFLPFDAELFGHWWFEGPLWLEGLFRSLAGAASLAPATVSEAAGRCRRPPSGTPAPSSWGERGDYSYWINRKTDWIYPFLAEAENRFLRISRPAEPQPKDPSFPRTLRQAARTLLLLQASDWPFMITSGTTSGLAQTYLESLMGRFDRLCGAMESDRIPPELLEACERADPAFPDLDLRHFSGSAPLRPRER